MWQCKLTKNERSKCPHYLKHSHENECSFLRWNTVCTYDPCFDEYVKAQKTSSNNSRETQAQVDEAKALEEQEGVVWG